MKFFNLIDVGERSGRGVYEIYRVWTNMGWDTPALIEALDLDRTVLTLPINKETTKRDDKKWTLGGGGDTFCIFPAAALGVCGIG